ncbi:MAG: alpha/beta fold hydrolase [Planctomycetota bacterium]|jgi:proline iminopeptidase
MIKKILIAAGVCVGLAVIVIGGLGWWAYLKFTGPLYEPGSLAASAALEPPARDGDGGPWVVEPGMRLHHFARGTGRPVLFVHGGPGFPTRTPMPWLDALYESFEVLFYDQRGCGESTRPFDRFGSTNFYTNMRQLEGTLGLGAQVADLERIRRILGEDRLILVGHSFGGFLAALYASEFPQRVEKLALLAPANMLIMPARDEDLFTLVRDRLPPERHPEYDGFLDEYFDFGALFEHDEEELARMHLRLGDYILEAMGGPSPEAPEPPAAIENGGWMVHAMYLSMGRRHDYSDALSRITADTLVVHGERDLQPASASARYAELIARAKLLRVADADHFFAGDHPELGRQVAAFLGDR